MADLRGFDATHVEPAQELGVIPAGSYMAVITQSEMKANKAGTGHFLLLTFQITEGPYRHRLLWARLNLHHPNPTAVQLARAELSALCRAVEVMAPRDSSELHHRPMVIQVKCRKRDDTGEITNEIKGYTRRETPSPEWNAPPPRSNQVAMTTEEIPW